MLDAFNRGDVDAVLATFDEGCALSEPPEMVDSSGFRGHDGIRAWMSNLRGVADVEFSPVGFDRAGDRLVVELASRGRGQASGAPFAWTTFAVFALDDQRIVRVEAFLTREEALAAARGGA